MFAFEVLEKITCKKIEPKQFANEEFTKPLDVDTKWDYLLSPYQNLLIVDEKGMTVEVPEYRIMVKVELQDDDIDLDRKKTVFLDNF